MIYSQKKNVIDLKSAKLSDTPPAKGSLMREESGHERWQDRICSGHGFSTNAPIPTVRCPVSWELPGSLF